MLLPRSDLPGQTERALAELALSGDWVAAKASAPTIECVPLGERFVLHSPRSGAILTTDHLGVAVLADPAAAARAADLPASVVGEIIRAWHDAGLFHAQAPQFPDPVEDRGQLAAHHVHYASRWGAISIETDDPVLARQLDEILWPFRVATRTTAPGGQLRCVGCDGGGLGVFRGARALWGRASVDVARYLIVREAAEALCGVDRVGAVLHGAAVCRQGKAILILGDSGRGKSTLAQGLIDAGCGYLADDHLPLHVNGTQILAFPTGSAIKRGARHLDEVRRLQALYGGRGGSRDGVSYLPLEAAVAPGTAVPLSAIVFPEHVTGEGLSMSPMDPEAAFVKAISSGSRPSRQGALIAPLVKLFSAVPAYALRYGTSSQSVRACLDLLAA